MTDFRALCADLVDALTAHGQPDDAAVGHVSGLLTRARAALAEPEIPSESPTDGELVGAYWEGWNECSKRENRDVHVAGLRAVYNLR